MASEYTCQGTTEHCQGICQKADFISLQGKIELLESGIRQLDDKLFSEVASRQEELLGQANSLRDAEGAVQVIFWQIPIRK